MIETKECLDDVPFSQLVRMVLPFVTLEDDGDLPDPVIESVIRDAAVEFMRETQFIRRTITIDAQCNVDEYPLELEDCYYVVSIRRVTVCGEGYAPIHEEDTGNLIARSSHLPDSHNLFHLSDRNWLVVEPVPCESVDGGIQVYASIAPSPDSCSIPREVYNEYGKSIVDGALAELLLIKSQAWYDAGQSVLRAKKFERAKAEARARALKGFVTGRHKGGSHRKRYSRGIR